MFAAAYLIFLSLAGFYTICLMRAGSKTMPKPPALTMSKPTSLDSPSFEVARSEKVLWQHSSGYGIGVAWECSSNSPENSWLETSSTQDLSNIPAPNNSRANSQVQALADKRPHGHLQRRSARSASR